MAVSKVLERWAFPVESSLGNLTAEEKQYRIVALTNTSTLQLAVSGSVTAYPLEDTPKAGEYGTVALVGVAKVQLSEEVKAGQLVSPNNEGKGQVAKTGQYVVGTALQTGETGQLIPILVHGVGSKV